MKKLIKNSIEYCGKLDFEEHFTGPKLLMLNKEYVSLEDKLNFAKNKFDFLCCHRTLNFADYQKIKSNLKFIYFPYAIS